MPDEPKTTFSGVSNAELALLQQALHDAVAARAMANVLCWSAEQVLAKRAEAPAKLEQAITDLEQAVQAWRKQA